MLMNIHIGVNAYPSILKPNRLGLLWTTSTDNWVESSSKSRINTTEESRSRATLTLNTASPMCKQNLFNFLQVTAQEISKYH